MRRSTVLLFAFVVMVSALLFTVSLFTAPKGRVIENPILGAATDIFVEGCEDMCGDTVLCSAILTALKGER